MGAKRRRPLLRFSLQPPNKTAKAFFMELIVTNLAVARGGVPLLEGISFRLGSGEALVLRGPNGGGKTTLLRTLAGLQPALSGEISCPPEQMAYGAHTDGLKATLSVQENLQFWASIHGQSDVTTALGAMNLTGLADRRAQHLSAGQKRRLGLARMMVTGRWLWVLDEPTVSLDAASVALFADVVRTHLTQGGAALIATHIELGLTGTQVLDLSPYKAAPLANSAFDAGFDEAFL